MKKNYQKPIINEELIELEDIIADSLGVDENPLANYDGGDGEEFGGEE